MSTTMLEKLVEERTSQASFVDKLTDTALSENRDLTGNELELITRAQSRVSDIDKQLDVLSKDMDLDAQAKERLARHRPGVASQGDKPAIEYRSAGAYLRDYLGTIIGEGEFKVAATDRLTRYHRAAAHIVTDNFTGVFPDAIVGPVINAINSTRPIVTALGTIGVPSGPSFRRPRLNDPNIATGVGVQAAQKNELVSQQFTMTSENVDLVTLGGYVNVARQVIDWGVASMDTIVNQLAARYSYATERAAIEEMALSASKIPLAAGADSATTIKAVYDGAALVYDKTGQLPTLFATGPKGWARLGGLSDQAGRQIFPFLAPSNAAGTQSADSFAGNPVGLRMVVTPGITDDTFWILNGQSMEIYEQQIGQLSVVEPSVLGVQVAFAGYFSAYRPFPDGAVHLAP